MHYFNPAQVMKLVEVVRCVTTTDAAFATALEFAKSEGKLAIPTKDRAGFIVNRLLVPYMLDAMRAYEEGIGSVGEIDEAMKAGAGHPMGPLTLADFVGLDTLGSICDVLFDEFRERRFAQPPVLRKMLSRGLVRAQVGDRLLRLLGRGAGREPGDLIRSGCGIWDRDRDQGSGLRSWDRKPKDARIVVPLSKLRVTMVIRGIRCLSMER